MSMFSQPGADVYIPDGAPFATAVSRITHLGIGAHQDDLEFMAYHGILECYGSTEKYFGGVTCTDGRGSARQGPFSEYTDDQMRDVRREEQRTAAAMGEFGLMIQLDVPTSALKTAADNPLTPDLLALFALMRPQVVYTHNPADKHETHLHVLAAVVDALRALPEDRRPQSLLGCEVWRGLDWMNDNEKVALDVSGRQELAAALNETFASQIAGGKRYDFATEGRRRANATYFTAHAVDKATHISLAMDLTPLIQDDRLDVTEFTLGYIDRFRSDVENNLRRALRR